MLLMSAVESAALAVYSSFVYTRNAIKYHAVYT